MIAVLCFLLLFILCLFWLNNICTCDPVQKGTGEETPCAPQALSSHLTAWIPLIKGSRASPSWTPSFRVWSSGWLVAGLCAALLHCWAGQRMLSVLQLLGGAFENNQHTIWTAAKVCCWLALVLFLIVLMERVASYPWDAFFKSIFDVLALELPGFRGCTEKGGWLVLLQSSPLGTLWPLSKGDSEPSLLWWVIWDQLLKSFLTVVKNTPANAGDAGSTHGLGRFPGNGNGNPLQYSYVGNPMDRGAWQTAVSEVTKESDTT